MEEKTDLELVDDAVQMLNLLNSKLGELASRHIMVNIEVNEFIGGYVTLNMTLSKLIFPKVTFYNTLSGGF